MNAKTMEKLVAFGLPAYSVHDNSFRYRILSRCQSDCEYFLGNGSGYEGHLWALDTDRHLELMQTLYDSFSKKEKPEWITQDLLDYYKAKMPKIKRAVV